MSNLMSVHCYAEFQQYHLACTIERGSWICPLCKKMILFVALFFLFVAFCKQVLFDSVVEQLTKQVNQSMHTAYCVI